MDQQRLILLLQRYHNNELSADEHDELLLVSNEEAIEMLSEKIESETFVRYIFKEGEAAAQIKTIIDSDTIIISPVRIAHRVHFLKTAWFRYAAAIIILFGIGAYLWNTLQNNKPLITQTQPVPVKNDLPPGNNRAILTLSNGEKIELNNSATETIKDGNLSIKNNSGQLIYGSTSLPIPSNGGVAPGVANSSTNPSDPGAGVGRGATTYNTMSTPRGGQYQLTLSDGTKVFLNAASSITYPTSFTTNNREVTISGEAYFEVSTNKSKPFIVKTNKDIITVLGTSFNINAYPDETSIKTSLINGSIKINEKILHPGQAYENGSINNTDITQDIAWKNGVFMFNKSDIKAVMRQLSRWYDIDIKYEGKIPAGEFTGDIRRNVSLQKVMNVLSAYDINYRIENKTIFISGK
jgi:transmembrane sensor